MRRLLSQTLITILLLSCLFIVKISDEQSICAIQDTKPDICRAYPTLDRGRRCLRGVFLED